MTRRPKGPPTPLDTKRIQSSDQIIKAIVGNILPTNPSTEPDNTWANMPCGVPSFNMTTGEYAKMVQHFIMKAEFTLAFRYLEAFQRAHGGTLDRLSLAAKRIRK